MQEKIMFINNRIQKEFCEEIIHSLSYFSLLPIYKEYTSVKKSIHKLKTVLEKHDICTSKQESIINDYMDNLVPPGTKGYVRGNKFNEIVKCRILALGLDKNEFDIGFEKPHEAFKTDEKPDWYIYNKVSQKIIIGMNQLDLWSGGQQRNRGSKYIINNVHNTPQSKLLCVICNKIKIKNMRVKAFKLFDIGFKHNTLCYINNLENIINEFFY